MIQKGKHFQLLDKKLRGTQGSLWRNVGIWYESGKHPEDKGETQGARVPVCPSELNCEDYGNVWMWGQGLSMVSRHRQACDPGLPVPSQGGVGESFEVSTVNPYFLRPLPFCKVTSSHIPARMSVTPAPGQPQTLKQTLFQKPACPAATVDQHGQTREDGPCDSATSGPQNAESEVGCLQVRNPDTLPPQKRNEGDCPRTPPTPTPCRNPCWVRKKHPPAPSTKRLQLLTTTSGCQCPDYLGDGCPCPS